MCGQQFYEYFYCTSRASERARKVERQRVRERTLVYFQGICFYLFAIFHATIFCSGCSGCSATVFDVKVPKVLGRLMFCQCTHIHTNTGTYSQTQHKHRQTKTATCSHLKPAPAAASCVSIFKWSWVPPALCSFLATWRKWHAVCGKQLLPL